MNAFTAREGACFPVKPNAKTPAVSGWQRWGGSIEPGQNYGIKTGPQSGVWVLDLDKRNGGKDGLASLRAYAAERGVELPDTLTVRSPSNGWHVYLAWDDATPIGNRAGVLPGVDVRGAGGYVVGPGSVIDGRAYAVAIDAPIAVAPDWLVELVGTAPEKVAGVSAVAITPEHPQWEYRRDLAARFLEGEPACISGQGGQAQIWKVALRIMRTYELPIDEAMRLLEPYNRRCLPPWSPEELTRTLARAAEHGQGPTGTFAEGFLAPTAIAPGTVDAASWRRKHDPAHAYTFDSAVDVHGGSDKESRIGDKELVRIFIGAAASPEWCGVWQWDTFNERVVAVDPPMRLDAETRGLSKADVGEVKLWLACKGFNVSTDRVQQAIEQSANACRFHPVCEYLDGLLSPSLDAARAYFDGIAGRLFGAKAEDDAIESEIFKRQLIAAVRRVRKPGTKVDTMLILQGPQGFYKSTLLASLFGEYFADSLPRDLADRDAMHALRGKWGVEFAELADWPKNEEEARKAFLSRLEDIYREYGSGLEIRRPRQCTFWGTTNNETFLRDPTGGRRYLIVHVREPIDLGAFDPDELWAAAAALEAAGERHYFDLGESGDLNDRRDEHAEIDAWDEPIARYLRALRERGELHVSAADALTFGIPVEIARQTKDMLKRTQAILRRFCGESRPRKPNGRTGPTVRMYRVPESMLDAEPASGMRIADFSNGAIVPAEPLPPARATA
jgi:hypothetical protein